MSVLRRWWLPLAAAVLLTTGAARADEHDELSKGNWDGKSRFTRSAPAGNEPEGGDPGGDPPPPPPPPGEGTPTPPPEEGSGGDNSRDVATPPSNDGEDDGSAGDDNTGGNGGTETGAPGDGELKEGEDDSPDDQAPEDEGVPSDPGGGDAPPAPGDPPPNPDCTAYWELEEMASPASLKEEHTALTILLFRTDSFGFISNGYCRASSTFVLDWFASTTVAYGTSKDYSVVLRLVGACPRCASRIEAAGLSQLEAKGQVKSLAGGLDPSTSAGSTCHTAWMGPLDCGDGASCTVAGKRGATTYGAEHEGAKISVSSMTNRHYLAVLAGHGAFVVLDARSLSQKVHNAGDVNVYAAGAENNAQAKARVAHALEFHGRSSCGAECEYELEIQSTD